MPQDNTAMSGQGQVTRDPRASDPHYIPDEVFERLPEDVRGMFKERVASLSRENDRMSKMLEKFNQPVRQPEQAVLANGKQPPRREADPSDVTTWDDGKIEQAIERFEQWEAAHAANPDDEKAKGIVTNLDIRKEINKARVELGRRAGAKAASEEMAPLRAEAEGRKEAESVFGNVFNYLSEKYGGAQRVSALLVEVKDDIDARLAALGKSRQTATAHETGLAMMAAVEARASNRDGNEDMGPRGRPEIAGEGFGARARAGAPDTDAEISALLRQKREPEANRKAMHRFLTDPSFVPPASMLPQWRADF